MPLKFKLKSREEAPAEIANLYVEREGARVLDVHGAVEKSKLDEFRNANVSLIKERDELKKRYEGIDPDEVRKLADEKRRLEEGKLLNGRQAPHPSPLPSAEREKIEKVVEARVKALKDDFDKQLSAATRRSPANSINPRTLRSPPCKTSSARLPSGPDR